MDSESRTVYVKRFIKTADDLPKDIILHVGNKKGFEELIYIENGKTKKPWRYDDNDIATLSINSIDWYMEPVEMPTEEEIEIEAENQSVDYDYIKDALIAWANWLLSRLK